MKNNNALNLETRVRRLELQNRALIVFGLLAVSVFGLMGLSRDDDGIVETLKARSLLIYSPDNEVVAEAKYSSSTGGGSLTIFDKSGLRRSWWRASLSGAHLLLDGKSAEEGENASGVHTVILSTTEKNGSASVFGPGGTVSINSSGEELPDINIWGKEGGRKPVFTTRVDG